MKFRISLVIVSLILSVLIGWAVSVKKYGEKTGASTASKEILIGLSMDTLKEARWQSDRDIFVARADELGARVLVQSANSDDTRQMQDVQGLLSNHVNALVIVPHDGPTMAKAVRLAHEAGVPVIAYDRLIPDCDLDLYLSFDNVRVGEKQAQYLVDHLPKNRVAKIVRIYGSKTDNNAFLVKRGQDNVLNPYLEKGQIRIIHEDWADDWKPEVAKRITNAAITRFGPNFDAILTSNDGTAGGAIQALLEEGLAGKIMVTGQDADLVACQRIAAGLQSMTVYKPIKNLATRAAELAVSLAKCKPVIATQAVFNNKINVPSVLLEVITVTRENLQQTVIADGFHTYEEIYGNAAHSKN